MSNRTVRNRKIKKAMLLGLAFGAIAGIIAASAAAAIITHVKKEEMAKKEKNLREENDVLKAQADMRSHLSDAAALSETEVDKWELIFVDDRYPLDKKYVPELEEISEGVFADSRIVQDLKKMLADGEQAGLKFTILSGYVSYDRQREMFNAAMHERVNNGMGYLDAYDDTRMSMAIPGHSEHASGLALDIISADYDAYDEAQKNSPEAEWLAENCSNYGFILRYPADKIDITNVGYEPWHYRYVGKEAAKEITEKKMTLEEYLLAK